MQPKNKASCKICIDSAHLRDTLISIISMLLQNSNIDRNIRSFDATLYSRRYCGFKTRKIYRSKSANEVIHESTFRNLEF